MANMDQMKPNCIHCNARLHLITCGITNYSWKCEVNCLETVDTGVPITEDIQPFKLVAVENGQLKIPEAARPSPPDRIPGLKVYMPQILHHFIECTWAGCYNSIYLNSIVPHLDSPSVVDYILRSPAIHGASASIAGRTGARIYGELLVRLGGVESERVQSYLRETF